MNNFFQASIFLNKPLSNTAHVPKKSFYEEDAADVMLMIFVCVVTNVNYQLQVNDVFEPKKLWLAIPTHQILYAYIYYDYNRHDYDNDEWLIPKVRRKDKKGKK